MQQLRHTAALGRPVGLGDLYDARSDAVLLGQRLWSEETVSQFTEAKDGGHTSFCVEANASFKTKARMLGISASQMLGYMARIISIEGSGKFLTQSRTSTKSESLTMQYDRITHSDIIATSAPMDFPRNSQSQGATHVVTGITYGARAFLAFEMQAHESEDRKQIKGQLEAAVDLIKANVSGECEYGRETGKIENRISCRYYGDYTIKQPPQNLKEAFGCMRQIVQSPAPKIAITIHLTPLSHFSDEAVLLALDMSEELVERAASYYQALNDAASSGRHLLQSVDAHLLPNEADRISHFIADIESHCTRYSKSVRLSLPKWRAGESSELVSVLTSFSEQLPEAEMKRWVSETEAGIQILMKCVDKLQQNGAVVIRRPEEATNILTDSSRLPVLIVEIRGSCQTVMGRAAPTAASHDLSSNRGQSPYSSLNCKLTQLLDFISRNSGTTCIVREGPPSGSSEVDLSLKCWTGEGSETEFQLLSEPQNFATNCAAKDANGGTAVTWTAPVSGKATGYRLTFVNTATEDAVENCVDGSSTSLRFDGCGSYNASICATCSLGESKPATLQFVLAGTCAAYVRSSLCLQKPLPKDQKEHFAGSIFELKKNALPNSSRCTCKADCVCPRSYSVGDPRMASRPAKFVLVVGETGSGKSTFVNGLANFYYGVDFKSDFRLKLIADSHNANQALSQTSAITVYMLYPVNVGHGDKGCSATNFPVVLIDTPGFGDTRGLAQDQKTVKQIEKVLGCDGSQAPGLSGILHMVTFLVKASQNRLTASQKYIFDSTMSLFGKDVEAILCPLFTFADSGEPQAMAALLEDKIPCETHFKFNNGAIYASNRDRKTFEFDSDLKKSERKRLENDMKAIKLDWGMCEVQYQELFETLQDRGEGVSLQATQEVLRHRKQLEMSVDLTLKYLKRGLCALTQIEQELEFIENLEEVIKDADRKKTRVVNKPTIEKRDVTHGGYVTLCRHCSKTCHDRCAFSDDNDKKHCAVMDWSGNCTQCPEKCKWDVHCNRNYYFVDVVVQETVTVEEIAEKYKVNLDEKEAKTKILEAQLNDFMKTSVTVSHNIVTIHSCLQELEKLALRQYPLSVVDYVENLIFVEESERKAGWQDRVNHLNRAKEGAQLIADTRGNANPLQERVEQVAQKVQQVINESLAREMQKEPRWKKMGKFFTDKVKSGAKAVGKAASKVAGY